jgi:membrane-bound inhibitor of C-type lysozyme
MRPLLLILPALLAGGCVYGPEMAVLPDSIAYRCAEGRELAVRRSPDGRAATVTLDGTDVTLQRMDSAAQEKYAGGAWTLYLEGDTATLESQGRIARAYCRSVAPLPVAPRMRYG